MCRGAMMVRELEQIGTDEKHTCAYVIRQQTRSAWLANLLRASNDHQSNILSINNVRVVYDVYIDERVQHCCTAYKVAEEWDVLSAMRHVGHGWADRIRFHNLRFRRPVARRKPSKERGMGSAASLIKAYTRRRWTVPSRRATLVLPVPVQVLTRRCRSDSIRLRFEPTLRERTESEGSYGSDIDSLGSQYRIYLMRDWIGERSEPIF